MDNRKKLAVFTANIYEPMVKAIQDGIKTAALEENIKVFYFTSFSDKFSSKVYSQYERYDKGDVVSFLLPDLDDFDGVIRVSFAYGTYTEKKLDEMIDTLNIPILNVGGKHDTFRYVSNDEQKSFMDIVEHVITEHNCKDIYHVAGKKDLYFTHERIAAYRTVLEKHGIPYDEDKIIYGTLWRDCGEDAVNYILSDCAKRGKEYPDAIVCANDYTAIGVIEACRSRGIEVPGDIIVTGYDGIEEALLGYPSITTSSQPFFDIGYESIHVFEKIWNGEDVPMATKLPGKLTRKQSCGCEPMSTVIVDDVRKRFQQRLHNSSYLAQSTTNLILSASNSDTIEECFDEISKNASIDTGFKNMLLCLAPGWDTKRIVDSTYSKVDEEMNVVAGFMGGKKITPSTFRKKDILPPELLADPYAYYIFPIHHLEYYMGYLIVTPDVDALDQLPMKSWIVNLGTMLENWRIRQELRRTLQHMENMYNRDMLTRLYNRHGYEMFFKDVFTECLEKNCGLAVLLLDMDDLKVINDNYGHSEGDSSLCVIADSMMAAAQNGELCFRTGGDEFVVLAKDYSEEKATEYIRALREQIELNSKPLFSIRVSIGACVRYPSESERDIIGELSEEYMKEADAAMYREKKAHKEDRYRTGY